MYVNSAHKKSYLFLGPVSRSKQSAFFYLHISYRLDLPGSTGSCIKKPGIKRKVTWSHYFFPPLSN